MLNTFNAYRNIDSIRNTELSSYKIGAVSRITGIGSETLRAWERRYAAVVPSRAESGDRQYSRDDVAKLLLLKTLVDSGISIGTIAKLSIDELKEHVEFNVNNQQHYEINTPKAHKFLDVDCSVALFGDCFPLRILDGLEEVQGINVVGTYDTFQEYQQRLDTNQQINVAIIEKPTINDDIHEEITKILEATGAWHVIVIYGFAHQDQIEQLQSTRVSVIRSAVDVQELARLCIFHSGGSEKLPALQTGSTLHYEQTIPSRKFNNQQLAKLASISSTIKCECPNHISDIVRDLVSFEIYSAECENENEQDAALHNYLHATTAQARSMLEEAMAHLIRVEGINLNQQ